MPGNGRLSLVLIWGLALVGCRREDRVFRPVMPGTEAVRWTGIGDLQPGPEGPAAPGAVEVGGPMGDEYEENAYAMAQGRKLFSAFNCVGCHGRGGGGMGPALMDADWIYGDQPQQIFATIVEGRPNGMPTFGRRIPAYQIWYLVAYVRSLSGLADSTAAPGRSDHMKAGQPPSSMKPDKSSSTSVPKPAEIP
jgi:cytochrome c oxidase cbb3-type subunit 3